MPGSNRSVVAEAKDLNPRSVNDFRYTRRTYNLVQAGTPQRARRTDSGEGVPRVLGEFVQFAIKRRAMTAAQLGDLRLELGNPTSESHDLEGESLLNSAAYVSQQGACHFPTFHVPADPFRTGRGGCQLLVVDPRAARR